MLIIKKWMAHGYFTPENMIRYIYKETSAEETAAIRLALESDWSLREKFELLRRSV